MASKDTAYTSLALEAHTDTTYFTEPAGLQMFHMLSHTGGSGGESLLVDGFAAARQLYGEDKEAYKVLSTVGIWAHASVRLLPCTFARSSAGPLGSGEMEQCRQSGDRSTQRYDRQVVRSCQVRVDLIRLTKGILKMDRKFNRILNDPQNQYWTQLEPGMPLSKCGGGVNRDSN
jgi:trimethyllysine dioxygenase